MCGIAGFCSFDGDLRSKRLELEGVLVKMRQSIAHRGHDQTGEYLGENIGLSHTRLSIRDIAGGRQPMVRTVGGTEYAIVYNGEVYNTDELIPELKAKGYSFETTCDTETVLFAYIEYGLDFAKKLNGIFAAAVWDGRRKRLVLCRDRLGVKPLFYTIKDGVLVFGSEIKALFCHPMISPQADDDSFREIFGIGPARTAGFGVFKNIREIRPGYLAVFSEEGFLEEKYWSLEALRHTESYGQTVERVSYLVRDAVTRQMVSDVSVCSFLSGGLDSSVVTAIASRYMEDSGAVLNTFSFDFEGNDASFKANSFQPTRDRPFVERMLSCFKLNHTYLECSETDLPELLSPALTARDLPGMTDIDASLLYFCSLVKKHNQVTLTGECADEIFGGYPWFYRPELLNADGFPWSWDLSARTVLLSDDVVRSLDLKEFAYQRYRDSLMEVPVLEGESPEERRRREVSFLNIRWFMAVLLERMDRASMSCGLEARVPFADHRIVEYLFNVPWHMKYREGMEKALLRDACSGLLPPELLYRKKSPYPKTYDPHYEALLAQRLRSVIDDPDAPVNRFIDREKALRFLSAPKDYGKPWFGQLMAAPQMIAYMLQVNEWMVRYNVG
ncbi:MAG: asparagine synthase (glutamine-hydrolyzing) [Oscillospiraceae bacterium]